MGRVIWIALMAAVAIAALCAGCGSSNGVSSGPPPPGWTDLGNGVAFVCNGHDGVYSNGSAIFVLASDPECAQ